jgi:chromosome segregation ATPase
LARADKIVTFDEKSGHIEAKERRHKASDASDVQPRTRKSVASPEAEIARLAAALADARNQARAAAEALSDSAEQIASLRRAKELAEAVAHDEFKLRLHMEGDRMLSDSTEKGLHATILSLRQQIEAAKPVLDEVDALKADIARGLERERAAQSQIATLQELLEAQRASIESLTAKCEALQSASQNRKKRFFLG